MAFRAALLASVLALSGLPAVAQVAPIYSPTVNGNLTMLNGSIENAPLGQVTPRIAAVTSLSATGNISLTNSGVLGSTGNLQIAPAAIANSVVFKTSASGSNILLVGGSSSNVAVQTQLTLPGRVWGAGGTQANASLLQNATWSGAPGGNINATMNLLQATEGLDVGGNGVVTLLAVNDIVGTTNYTGLRNTFVVGLTVSAPPGTGGGADYVAGTMKATGSVNVGGTAPTLIGSVGAAFASNPVAVLTASATNWSQVVGEEIDVGAMTGSSVRDKLGLQIVDLGGSTVHGTEDDMALSLNNQYAPSSSLGWTVGIGFGRFGGFFPISATGTMIGGEGNNGVNFNVANGIDWHLGTASNKWLQFGSVFSIDGSGNVTAASYKSGASAGVSCATGTVTAATMVVTNGIVTHC